MSNSQIDRLGERLKSGNAGEDDLKLLAEYRRTFDAPFAEALRRIQASSGFTPTVRTAKTTASVVAKLQRERTSLSSMQDLAGCRLIVEDVAAQDAIVRTLEGIFPGAKKVDRRVKPSHGYRAVHLIIRYEGKRIEIQIRTQIQQLWAELSEKVSDQIDPRVKYGAAPARLQTHLLKMSELVKDVEACEVELLRLAKTNAASAELKELTEKLDALRQALRQVFLDRLILIMIEHGQQGDQNVFHD